MSTDEWRRCGISVWLKVKVLVAKSCPTLCDPTDCSLPGPSVHGIFQAIVLEWIALPFSRGSSWPRDRTRVSHTVDRCFTIWATREVLRSLPKCCNLLFPLSSFCSFYTMNEREENWKKGKSSSIFTKCATMTILINTSRSMLGGFKQTA